jgi:hypothetical protein
MFVDVGARAACVVAADDEASPAKQETVQKPCMRLIAQSSRKGTISSRSASSDSYQCTDAQATSRLNWKRQTWNTDLSDKTAHKEDLLALRLVGSRSGF